MAGAQPSPQAAKFAGGIFCAAAAFFMLIGAGQVQRQAERLNTFIPVPAQVVGVSVESRPTTKKTWYVPKVDFTYVVNGQAFTAHTPTVSDTSHGDLAKSEAIVSRFRVGAEVTAWHSPSDPEDAYLIHEADFAPYAFILFPMIHFAVGLLAMAGFMVAKGSVRPPGAARSLMPIAGVWTVVGLATAGHFLAVAGGRLGVGSGLAFAAYFAVGIGMVISSRRMQAKAAMTIAQAP